MRTGDLRSFIQAHEQAAGKDNKPLAWRNAANQLRQLLEGGEVKPQDFSLRELYRELVETEHGVDLRFASTDQIMEAVSASAFPYITGELISKTIMDEYNVNIGDVASLVTEGDATDFDTTVAGFGAGEGLEEVGEGMPYEETTLTEKRATIRSGKFGRIIPVTREMVLFDKTGQVLNRARNVGRKAGQHRARMIVQTIEMEPRTAFGETSSTIRAAVLNGTAITQSNFYNTDHSSVSGLDGQVNANTVSDALTTSGISNALNRFANMVDERGDEIQIVPSVLLVHPLDGPTAWQLVRSTNQFDTANNALNPYGPGGYRTFKVVESVFIETSSTRNWYLGDFAQQLFWLWGWKPETLVQTKDSNISFEKDIITRYRFSYFGGCGHVDYRYIVRGAE